MCRPERGLPWVKQPRPAEYWPVDALELAQRLAWGDETPTSEQTNQGHAYASTSRLMGMRH